MSAGESKIAKKEVEFYGAALTAWFTTRLELDKNLLTLSAGGIGLLITLVSTVGVDSAEGLVLYVLSILAFLACIAVVLFVLRRNSTHIANVVIKGEMTDPTLALLDKAAVFAFIAGVTFAAIIGIGAAIHSFQAKEVTMSVENKATGSRPVVGDSVNGMSAMRPAATVELKKSFEGAAKLAPAAPEAPPQPPAQQPASLPTPTTVEKAK